MTEYVRLMLQLHDGDDRCGCLRQIIEQLLSGCSEATAQVTLEHCLRHHPAGSRYRA